MDFFKTLGKIGGSHDGLNSYNMLQPILGLEKGKKFGQNKGYSWFSINTYNMLQPILGLEKGKKLGQILG